MQSNQTAQAEANSETFQPGKRVHRHDYSLASAVQLRENQLSRKATLLADSTRNFCELDRPTRQEIDIFKELFYQMIGGCGKSERRLLSASLARNVYTPRQILMYLAIDAADIAAPVLLFSPAINEFDIATLAGRLSLDHLKILCRRLDLSSESAKVLEKAGGEECVRLLAKNPSLARLKNGDGKVSRPIATPARTNEDNLPGQTPTENVASRRSSTQNEIVELAGRGGKLGRSKKNSSVPFKYNPEIPFDGQLLQAARKGQRDGLAEIVESYCGISSRIVRQLLDEPDAENLCVLFKGLGIGFVGTLQLLLLLNRNVSSNRSNYDRIKKLISEVSFDECRRFLEKLGGNFAEPKSVAVQPVTSNSLMDAVVSRRREISRNASEPINSVRNPDTLRDTG
ncbi:MAG: hypothetical protein ACR2O0_06615 [Rhizobiaceae bacterium]